MRGKKGVKAGAITTMALVVAGNVAVWALALVALRSDIHGGGKGHENVSLLLIGWTAYLLGLAHALDADHICAIDNVTRKLMQEGQRPAAVGFFFSLGHSTIVILLTLAVAVAAAGIESHFDALENAGGIIGTVISAVFLFAIASMNLMVLRSVARTFGRIRRGEAYEDQDLGTILDSMGWIGPKVRPLLRLLDRSWKMYA
ncbi:MAG TPA: hypothetical protein VMD30_10725, partial [Tepidisphaeraceae bacterium]|nr:hypothetical protein [Tepidisphaeraceae bacterium]